MADTPAPAEGDMDWARDLVNDAIANHKPLRPTVAAAITAARSEGEAAGYARGIEDAAKHAMQRQYTHLCSSCGLNDGEYEERSIEVRTARRIAAGIRTLPARQDRIDA